MSRPGAVAARAQIEAEHAPDALLAFLTISHPGLADPLRVVSDVMDYLRDGHLYQGVPFGFRLLTDADGSPVTELRLANADRRLGEALRGFTGRPVVALELCSSADFDLSLNPRAPLGAVSVIYGFSHFTMADVDVGPMEITGQVMLQDYSVEPWPSVRGTQDRLPGLFR